MQRNSHPVRWRPKGLSDAISATNVFPGAMSSLQNLIFDPSTTMVWQCRPAAKLLVTLSAGGPFSSGFSSGFQGSLSGASFISCFRIVGDYVYGMIATNSPAGYDTPFCYNITTNSPIAVGGTLSATTLPVSPPTTGAWTPPQMALIGVKLMVCHSGFSGAGGNFVGWFDLTNPGAPVWNAGNLTGGFVSFTVAPTGVTQFFNRAYYIHNAPGAPAVIFSDALNATNVTNANQVLTLGDNTPLTAIGGLPLNNELGGIIQSAIVFKNTTVMYQITGDPGLNNLAVNTLNVATGTLAPNTVASTPLGLSFIAPDGLRYIDFTGNVQGPIGLDGDGVTVPFVYSSVPTRMCSACNGNLLRITSQNGNIGSAPIYEYWFDFVRQAWTGPHTFPASLIAAYQQTFIMTPVAVNASLWQSDSVQSTSSTFIENGAQMTWQYQTPLFPDTEQMTNTSMTEATLELAIPPLSAPVAVTARDQSDATMNSVSVSAPQTTTTIWGSFVWGQAQWAGGASAQMAPYRLPWTAPVTFSKMSIGASGSSVVGFKIGTLRMRFQILRQFINTQAAA